MTKTVTTERAFGEVLKHVEAICNDAAHAMETIDNGDAWAQGDVLILRIANRPTSISIKPKPQIAPGVTQGSRHAIADMTGIRMYRLSDPTPLDGPIIEAESPFTVTHPEHGDITCPAGTYAVIYQRAFATELKRQLD